MPRRGGNESCPGGFLGGFPKFGRASCCATGLSLSPETIELLELGIPRQGLSPVTHRSQRNTFLARQLIKLRLLSH
ncbi:hypothetical protein V6N13_061274 [Hibiscus sabdariffa]